MSLQIVNVRLGFANNSSSSHSMILLEPDQRVAHDGADGDYGYGWEQFTLVEKAAKEDYLASAIYNALVSNVGPAAAMRVLSDLLEREPSIAPVDHQSVLGIPLTAAGDLNTEFLADLVTWVRSPQVAILGGNDNGGEHPLLGEEENEISEERVLNMRYWEQMRAEKNPDTGVWTLFNARNGARVKLSLFPNSLPIEKQQQSKRPDLVDVKITDYCPYQCDYCYQGSTLEGQHASLAEIARVAQALGSANVFEAALGGGETTLHPHFLQVLDIFRQHGVTPNVTTRNLSWLRSPKVEELKGRVGSVAISVDTLDKAEEALSLIKAAGLSYSASLQVVVGTLSESDMKKLMTAMWREGTGLTLLGYKHTGLGEDWQLQNENAAIIERTTRNWAKWVQETRPSDLPRWQQINLRIDTTLAAACPEALKEAGVSEVLYHSEEGQSSMYIDAVRAIQSPSSYADKDKEVAFNPQTWLEVFQQQALQRQRQIKVRVK